MEDGVFDLLNLNQRMFNEPNNCWWQYATEVSAGANCGYTKRTQ